MKNLASTPNPTLDLKELAAILHKSPRTVWRYLKENPSALPPGKKVGYTWVWVRVEVIKWLSPTPTPKNISTTLGDDLNALATKKYL